MDYYEYDQSQPNWWIKKPPPRNEKFDKELIKLAGTNYFGNPILKAEWMGTLMSDSSYQPSLAFKTIWEGITHYDHSGIISTPIHQRLELGVLRWGIFKWMSTEEAIKGGRFNPDARGADGKPIYRRPTQQGIYNLFFKIETADGKFRNLDEDVLYAVRQIWHYNENTTIEQKIKHLQEDEIKEAKAGSETARAVWY